MNIPPLFCVVLCLLHRNLQCTCDAHEAMREDGELNGVELSAEDTLTVRAYSHAHVAPLY